MVDAPWPVRGQQAPDYWDDQLKAYVDQNDGEAKAAAAAAQATADDAQANADNAQAAADAAQQTANDAAEAAANSAASVSELTDYDGTVAAKAGDVLVYDAVTSKWKPGKGGPEVGAWENDLQTNFVYPAPVEYDLQANPPSWPNGRQSVPSHEITITPEMLITNPGGADLGYETGIFVMGSTRVLSPLVGTGNPNVEAAVWRAASGVETVAPNSSQIGAPGAGVRMAWSVYIPHVKVGDKVRVRLWAGTNGPNFRTDWWAHRSVVSKIGHKTNDGRIGLFRDIVRTGAIGTYTPATVLTNAPTAWAPWGGGDPTREQWLDNGILIGQNNTPPQARTFLADPSPAQMGIMTTGDGISGTGWSSVAAGDTTKAYLMGLNNISTQFRMDRLWVPAPPT